MSWRNNPSANPLRVWLIVGVLFGLLIGTAAPALAHYVYEEAYTYWSSDSCTWGRSETSHGSGGGYAQGDAEAHRGTRTIFFGTVECSLDFDRPPGYLAVRWDWLYWTGSEWAVCAYYDWQYNSTTTHRMVLDYDFGSSPWCGSGYYGTSAGSSHYNGGWHGGYIWSGYHWLPA